MTHGLLLAVVATISVVATAVSGADLAWTKVTATGTAPDKLDIPATCYHASSNTVYVFGGKSGGSYTSDIYKLDVGTDVWSLVTPSTSSGPVARFSVVSSCYEDSLVIALGEGNDASGSKEFYNDAWAFDFTTLEWQRLDDKDSEGPVVRYGSVGGIVDGTLTIAQGFSDDGRQNDVWSLDVPAALGSPQAWEDITPGWPALVEPIRRCLHSGAWIGADRDQMVIVGGCASGFGPCPLNDAWKYTHGSDGTSGSWASISTGPEARIYSNLERWHADDDSAILYGGDSHTDLQIYDGSSWMEVTGVTGDSPGTRSRGAFLLIEPTGSDPYYMFIWGNGGDSGTHYYTLTGSDIPSSTDTPVHGSESMIYLSIITFWVVIPVLLLVGWLIRSTSFGFMIWHSFPLRNLKSPGARAMATMSAGEFIIVIIWVFALLIGFSASKTFVGSTRAAGRVATHAFGYLSWFGLARFTPLDKTRVIKYHIGAGMAAIILTLVHMFGMISQKLPSSKVHSPLFGLIVGVCCILLWITALPPIRRKKWEIFTIAHHLYVPVFFFTILHASTAALVMVIPLTLHAIQRAIRLYRTFFGTPWKVEKAVAHDSFTELVLSSPTITNSTHNGGQYFVVRIKEISSMQAHPFSASSIPGTNSLRFLIKDMGEGTYTNLLRKAAATHGKDLTVRVDGPFGHSSLDMASHDSFVLVAGGVGITPLFTTVASLASRVARDRKLSLPDLVSPGEEYTEEGCIARRRSKIPVKKITLLWSTRDAQMVASLAPELVALASLDVVDIRVHYTGKADIGKILSGADGEQKATESLVVELEERKESSANPSDDEASSLMVSPSSVNTDIIMGLIKKGRPDIPGVFAEVAEGSDVKRVGVMACGPPRLASAARAASSYFGHKNSVRFHFHSEVFEF